jgi:hypothetical protein
MANPVLTGTTNKTTYAPGEAITGTWQATDADNANLTVRVEGTDSQGFAALIDVTVTRLDPFTVSRVYIVETGTDLSFNQSARTFSGTVPTA